ncbi:MAG: hypothetical protein ABR591_07740 [Candidatus Velthaea sp.]
MQTTASGACAEIGSGASRAYDAAIEDRTIVDRARPQLQTA